MYKWPSGNRIAGGATPAGRIAAGKCLAREQERKNAAKANMGDFQISEPQPTCVADASNLPYFPRDSVAFACAFGGWWLPLWCIRGAGV